MQYYLYTGIQLVQYNPASITEPAHSLSQQCYLTLHALG